MKEYWIIDPEPETVEVLCLTGSGYELSMRRGPDETAASRLLPGFEIKVNGLFHPR